MKEKIISGVIATVIGGLILWIIQINYDTIKNIFSSQTHSSIEESSKPKEDKSYTNSESNPDKTKPFKNNIPENISNQIMPAETPIFRFTSKNDLSEFETKTMLTQNNFFDKRMNESGDGFPNDFELRENGQIVIDNATHLMWQQSGSRHRMRHNQAQVYIDSLNSAKFAGYSDWRLPTLEEAMSLMEVLKRKDNLHIHQVFDQQWGIWTSDKTVSSEAWAIYFDRGSCTYKTIDCFVKAVRLY